MAGITPILKRSRESRGKRLIAYTGPVAGHHDYGQPMALDTGSDVPPYTSRNIRVLDRGSADNAGGLVYVLPADGNGSSGVRPTRTSIPSGIVSVSDSSDSSRSTSSRRQLLRPTTSSPQLPVVPAREISRYNPNIANLPPGAILLSQLELGQTAARASNQPSQAYVPNSGGYFYSPTQPQPYSQSPHGVPHPRASVKLPSPSSYVASSSSQEPVRSRSTSVHFEDELRYRSCA